MIWVDVNIATGEEWCPRCKHIHDVGELVLADSYMDTVYLFCNSECWEQWFRHVEAVCAAL